MSYVDYSRAAQGYWIRHARYLEGQRIVCDVLMKMHIGRKAPKPTKWMPLLTDPPLEIISPKLPSKEELFELTKKYFGK